MAVHSVLCMHAYFVSLKQAYLSLVAITSHDWPALKQAGCLKKLMGQPGLKYKLFANG